MRDRRPSAGPTQWRPKLAGSRKGLYYSVAAKEDADDNETADLGGTVMEGLAANKPLKQSHKPAFMYHEEEDEDDEEPDLEPKAPVAKMVAQEELVQDDGVTAADERDGSPLFVGQMLSRLGRDERVTVR